VRRAALAWALSFTAAAILAAPAHGLPILSATDGQALAGLLAQATTQQGVCYGWAVTLSGARQGTDEGSSSGAGVALDTQSCAKWILFSGSIVLQPVSSDADDTASFHVTSNLAGAPGDSDLADHGVSADDLVGEQADLALANAVSLLPLLAAARGVAAPLQLRSGEGALAPGDRPAGGPGSDFLRVYGWGLGLAFAVFFGGLTWFLITLFRRRSRPKPQRASL
jgi:hypothetical protein